MDVVLTQERVREHWNRRPCDSEPSAREPSSREFFLDVERQRYALQPHILECQSWINWRGRRVLEVGAGVGTDARQLIRAGALYTGINVDRGSADTTSRALRVFNLPGASLQRDATSLDFPDNSFDIVYSFGVLQHIPRVELAVAEITRVLKPGGEVVVMLYNRSSINYRIEIMFLRRLGVRLLTIPGMVGLLALLGLPRGKLLQHRKLYRELGLMSREEWLGRNTNGPDYPWCRVYDESEATRLFAGFEFLRHEVRFFDHRHWGVLGRALPRALRRWLGQHWGWHRMLHMRKPAPRPLDSGGAGA